MKKYIPRYLDEPERILCWTIDEFACLMLPIIIGFAINIFWFGLVIGPALIMLVVKLKQEKGRVQGICYWHLPRRMTSFRKVPLSCYRFWVG